MWGRIKMRELRCSHCGSHIFIFGDEVNEINRLQEKLKESDLLIDNLMNERDFLKEEVSDLKDEKRFLEERIWYLEDELQRK